MNDTVMIAMSGGVDSAVAAYLTKESAQGAAGVTMNLCYGQIENACAAQADAADAAAVCKALQIPHFVADLGKDFFKAVITPFISSYTQGLTPNPCIQCNREIKFGALLRFALDKGFDKIATGHYARIEKSEGGRALLRRAADLTKDQSYVLYTLSQDALLRTQFPLGSLKKAEVREIAQGLSFPMANKRDSQDICFIPDGDYAAFIQSNTKISLPPASFVSTDGAPIAPAKSIIHYTIGQRKGLGIALGEPMYVVSKSAQENTVTLGRNEQLFSSSLTARNINLIPFDTLHGKMRVKAKVRYRQEAVSATVEQIEKDRLHIEFDTPQRAISPGQSLVLYEDDYVIGGGIIEP